MKLIYFKGGFIQEFIEIHSCVLWSFPQKKVQNRYLSSTCLRILFTEVRTFWDQTTFMMRICLKNEKPTLKHWAFLLTEKIKFDYCFFFDLLHIIFCVNFRKLSLFTALLVYLILLKSQDLILFSIWISKSNQTEYILHISMYMITRTCLQKKILKW